MASFYGTHHVQLPVSFPDGKYVFCFVPFLSCSEILAENYEVFLPHVPVFSALFLLQATPLDFTASLAQEN